MLFLKSDELLQPLFTLFNSLPELLIVLPNSFLINISLLSVLSIPRLETSRHSILLEYAWGGQSLLSIWMIPWGGHHLRIQADLNSVERFVNILSEPFTTERFDPSF
jgi:hypothetical protein